MCVYKQHAEGLSLLSAVCSEHSVTAAARQFLTSWGWWIWKEFLGLIWLFVSNTADTSSIIPENTELECPCQLLAGLKVKNFHHKYSNLISSGPVQTALSQDAEYNTWLHSLHVCSEWWSLHVRVRPILMEKDSELQSEDNTNRGCKELEANTLWSHPGFVFYSTTTSPASKNTKGRYRMFPF